jgi:L-ascorbate metabolism protein UlaG (beta-lactamase superfamily)
MESVLVQALDLHHFDFAGIVKQDQLHFTALPAGELAGEIVEWNAAPCVVSIDCDDRISNHDTGPRSSPALSDLRKRWIRVAFLKPRAYPVTLIGRRDVSPQVCVSQKQKKKAGQQREISHGLHHQP